MFKTWYQSSYHHPYLFWLLQLVALLWILLGRKRRLSRLFVGLIVVSALDAWLSANHLSPISNKKLATISAFAFVILGDARFFVLLSLRERLEAKRIAASLALAMLVPAASSIFMFTHPDSSRILFLGYELMFFALAATIRWIVIPKTKSLDGPWQRKLCHFELAQYGLWALADVVILAGFDVGFLLRIAPNLLYYGAFVPYAYFSQEEASTPAGTAAAPNSQGQDDSPG